LLDFSSQVLTNQTVAGRFQLQRGSSTLKGRKERPMLPLSALLVGTALLGLPAAAQKTNHFR
jgi:hypothetical protein